MQCRSPFASPKPSISIGSRVPSRTGGQLARIEHYWAPVRRWATSEPSDFWVDRSGIDILIEEVYEREDHRKGGNNEIHEHPQTGRRCADRRRLASDVLTQPGSGLS